MFDDYLAGVGPGENQVLQGIIDKVGKIAPEATEGRSYGLPAFRYHGKPLLGFAVTKNHLSLYPFSAAVLEHAKERLAGFDVSKGTVRFTLEKPVPNDVVEEIVLARMAEIDR